MKDRDRAVERVLAFREIFGEDFYLEIQTVTDEEQREYNEYVLGLAKEMGIKTIVTEDAHYVNRADADIHRKWIEVDGKSGYYSTDDYYLHSDEEVRQALSYVPDIEQIINTTEEVGRKCEQVTLEFGKKNYPVVDLGGKTPRQAVEERMRPPVDTARAKYELGVLEQCDYLTYLLINEEMIRWCRSKGINIGRGRGAVCGSLVAYLLDITRVDPLRFGLFFERFANVERITPPDIDTDVPNSKRAQVIEYLKEKYKEVYHVRTFGTTADKTAIQRAARALGYKPQTVQKLSKEADTINDVKDEKVRELAGKFTGLIQQYGKHASALIVFPSEAEKFCAIERQGGDYVCAYEFADLEKMGLLKLDILGMKTLDTITEAVNLIRQNHGVKVDLDNLPVDDKTTFEMLSKGDTLGCFQIESAGMRRLITELQPQSLFDLVPLIALFRPSSIQSGVVDEYIRNKKSGKIEHIHTALELALEETYGVLLYQEQAMRIVQTVAGYTLAKADVFRRAIGHKDEEKMTELIKTFKADGAKNGFDTETMSKLAEWLKNCASYQFNKSHSAAYALLCYQTAYLKANYPVEYLAAYLNAHREEKQEDLLPYIGCAKNLGIKILPPDARSETVDWQVKKGMLVTALRFIKGIGDLHLPLTEEKLVRLPKNKILCLIKSGALDHLDVRDALVKKYLREEYVQKYKTAHKKLLKCRQQLEQVRGSLLRTPDDDASLEWQKETIESELKEIENEYRALEREAEMGEKDVLGFEFDGKFRRFDTSQFDEPDPQSDEKKMVLCYVHKVKLGGEAQYTTAVLTIETPAGKFIDVKMTSRDYEPVAENTFCIFRLVKDKVRLVVQKNA